MPEYNPDKDQIEKILKRTGSDPRKLAIAYLRAKKRADESSMAFRVLEGITEARNSVRDGDGETAIKELERTLRRMKA